MSAKGRRVARYALATIRLINGIGALFAPKFLFKRLGVEIDSQDKAIYFERLFGIRTIMLGVDLFVADDDRLQRALKMGVLIHGSDTVSAALTGVRHQLPKKAAMMATAISAVNVALAVAALDRDR